MVPQRKLSKNATAIKDLEELVTPRCADSSIANNKLNFVDKIKEVENQKY